MEMIKLTNVSKKYGDKVIYSEFNLTVNKNQTLVVLGESGSGKTTLINLMLNLTEYDGNIEGISFPVATVFQQDRLVKNLTVSENLRLVAPNIDTVKALKEVGLEGIENSYVNSLSGGMARRVALARAINFPSNFMFLDEPFINLDLAHKYKIMDLIKGNLNKTPKTVVMVTHDVKEAVYMADRIVVLSKGKIIYDDSQINEKTEKILFDLLININND